MLSLIRLASSLSFLLLLLVLPLTTQAALFPKNSKVVQLTSSNFKSQVLGIEKPTFVAFTAPWCGHCQKLVPEYSKAAKSLDGIIKFANLDCDQDSNKPLCGQYGVKGFPTLKMFPPTKKRLAKDYQGPREAKGLIDYAVDQLPLGAKKLKAEELLDWVEKNSDTPRVILFSTKHSSTPMYKSLALDYKTSMKFAFLKADVASVRSSARIHLGLDIKDESDLPQIIVIPASEDGFQKGDFLKYEGNVGYFGIRDWLKEISPKVGARSNGSKSESSKSSRSSKSNQKAKTQNVRVDSNEKSKKAQGQGVKLGKNSSKKQSDQDDEEEEGRNPARGSYEWKPQKKEDLKKKERDEKVKAEKESLEKEEKRKRFSEAHEKTKKKLEEAKKKGKGQENDPKKLVFGENDAQKSRSKTKSKDSKGSSKLESEYLEENSNPIFSAAASMASSVASAGQEVYSNLADAGKDAFEAGKDAYEYVAKEGKEAYEYVSKEGKEAFDGLVENISETSDRIKEAVGIKEGNDQKEDKDEEEDEDDDSTSSSDYYERDSDSTSTNTNSQQDDEASSDSEWDTTKSKLLKTFKSFMSSENVDIDEEYSSDVKEAQLDALRIFKESPEKALQMAKDAEEWLLNNFQMDKDSMADLLGSFQQSNLNEMLNTVKERFEGKKRKGVKGYNEVLDEEEEELQRKQEIEESKERERLRKKSYDEL